MGVLSVGLQRSMPFGLRSPSLWNNRMFGKGVRTSKVRRSPGAYISRAYTFSKSALRLQGHDFFYPPYLDVTTSKVLSLR